MATLMARSRPLSMIFFFQAEDGIRDLTVTGVQTCALPIYYAAALAAAESAAVVLVLDEPDIPVRTAGTLIYAGTVLPERARDADVVLPIVNVAEEDGSFVNRDGRVQRYAQAKPAPGMAPPGWWVFSELGAALGHGEPVGSAAEAFERVAQAIDALRGLSYEQLGFLGKVAAAPVAV